MKLIFISFISTLILFNPFLFSQEFQLDITAEQPISKKLKINLELPKSINFDDQEETLQKISDQLIKLGYLESELKSISVKTDSLYIVADYFLGQEYKTTLLLFNNEQFSKQEFEKANLKKITVSENQIAISTAEVENALHKINIVKSNSGFPFSRIKLSNIETRNDTIVARLIISNDIQRKIDSIVIRGYEKFPQPFLKYKIGLRKDQILNQEKLLDKNKRIQALPFVTTIRPPEILFRQDSSIVYLYLKKENNNVFDGVIGFSTDENTNKMIFNGYLNLNLNNNFNYGEEFHVNYRADGHEQLEFQTGLKTPFLLGSRVGMKTELSIFKRDSSFISTIQKHNLTYQINYNSQLQSGYESHSSAILLNELHATQSIESYTSKFWTSGFSITTTQNNPLFPVKTILLLETAIGSRRKTNQRSKQWKSEAQVSNIFNLNSNHSILVTSRTAYISSKSYLLNELFRFGGTNSIRGFDENSIDASLYSVLNLEYRYQFSEDLFVHTLTDAAYFENPVFSIKQKLYSFGFGIGINSKSGLFRFQIANGMSPNQKTSISASKIHINFLTKF